MAAEVRLEMSGRVGELIFDDGRREIRAHAEVSGALAFDLLVSASELWSSDSSHISQEDRQRVLAAFKEWAKKEGVSCEW